MARPRPLLALVSFLLAACGASETTAPDRPNIVVVVIDTLRADRLPFYGNTKNTAPFLQELAEKGVVFENAWSTSSWTAPSTASLFTSKLPNEHGVRYGMHFADVNAGKVSLSAIDESLETLPVFLRNEGYRTYGIADNLNIGTKLGFAEGFDRFEHTAEDLEPKWAAVVNDKVREWAPELSEGKSPFFLYLHYMDPHRPYRRHEQWIEPGTPVPKDPMDDVPAYDSEIRYVDEAIEEALAMLPLDENCWIFVLSDHGEEFRDHGGTGHFLLYSEVLQIPFLVHSPDHPEIQGRISGDVSLLDVLPTIREIVGAPPSPDDRGTSLLPFLHGKEVGTRPHFAMRSYTPPLRRRALVLAGYKLIVTEPRGSVELFDLNADPDETKNIARAEPDRVKRMLAIVRDQARVAEARQAGRAEEFTPSEEQRRILESLGYTGDK